MPHFSSSSARKLGQCDDSLQRLFHQVIKGFDCTVLTGHRGQEEQDQAVAEGRSKTPWPSSKHNTRPSLGVDVAPYPIDWEDRDRFHMFAGYVIATAESMGIQIRWGGDWDGDKQTKDNSFDDLVHWEIS